METIFISICKCGRYLADDMTWQKPTVKVKLNILYIKLGFVPDVKISTILLCNYCEEKRSKR